MTNGGYAERPRHTDMIRQHSVVFQFLKVNKTTTERKCYGASKYLKNLNQDQSYQPVKIEKSHCVVKSRPVCLVLAMASSKYKLVKPEHLNHEALYSQCDILFGKVYS
jgi:hypothetical protein